MAVWAEVAGLVMVLCQAFDATHGLAWGLEQGGKAPADAAFE
jgi:hypothetical protein